MEKISAADFNLLIESGEIKTNDKGRMSFKQRDACLQSLIQKARNKKVKKPRRARHLYLTPKHILETFDSYYKKGSIYIPYNVCSSKNSNQIVNNNGKMAIIHSKQYQQYKKLSKEYWLKARMLFDELIKGHKKPYKLGFYYIRYSDDHFDFHNAHQGPADLMQEFGWIEDDDKKTLKIIPEGYHVDKETQGLIITPLKRYRDAKEQR